MKYLKLYCIIIVIPIFLCSGCAKPHKKASKTNYFSNLIFLPDSNKVKMYKVEKDTIQFIRNLDYDVSTDLVVSSNGWIAGLDYEYDTSGGRYVKRDSIFIARIDSNYNVKYYNPIPTGSASTNEDISNIAIDGNVLYVCEKAREQALKKSSIVFTIDLNKSWTERNYIAIPNELKNKSIDAFLFKRDTVILVDDVEIPKYLIDYRNQNNKLEYLRFHELPIGGPSERILKAIKNDKYILLLCSSFMLHSVRVLRADTYEQVEEISFSFTNKKSEEVSSIVDLYLAKMYGADVIALALGQEGVGLWNSQAEYKSRSASFIKPKTLDSVSRVLFANEKMLIVSDGRIFEIIPLSK